MKPTPTAKIPGKGVGDGQQYIALTCSCSKLLRLSRIASFFRQSQTQAQSSRPHSVSPARNGGRKTIESYPSSLLSILLPPRVGREGTSCQTTPPPMCASTLNTIVTPQESVLGGHQSCSPLEGLSVLWSGFGFDCRSQLWIISGSLVLLGSDLGVAPGPHLGSV